MARKRMISPYMWESETFSALSDFSKLVFISLISHADDEGRGKAKPAYIANITFPNDETRRVTDVKKALSEIALTMSIRFYEVNGNEYYVLTHWFDYQKIDKPTPSKLPPPLYDGEGGEVHSEEKFGEYSGNTRGEVGEGSAPNISKDNIKEYNIPPISAGAGARTREGVNEALQAFCQRFNITVDGYDATLGDIDFDKLTERYEHSKTFLQDKPLARSLKWICKNYAAILSGKYDDFEERPVGGKSTAHERGTDILKNVFNILKEDEE